VILDTSVQDFAVVLLVRRELLFTVPAEKWFSEALLKRGHTGQSRPDTSIDSMFFVIRGLVKKLRNNVRILEWFVSLTEPTSHDFSPSTAPPRVVEDPFLSILI